MLILQILAAGQALIVIMLKIIGTPVHWVVFWLMRLVLSIMKLLAGVKVKSLSVSLSV